MSGTEHTIAIGLVPHRGDGAISLHVGPSFVLLKPNDIESLIATLRGFVPVPVVKVSA